MNRLLLMLTMFVCISFACFSQEDTWQGSSVNFTQGRLTVSPDGRYLQHKNGTPFFYLADTAWELFHRLNEEEVEKYLENRRAKGFTVIQAVILAELDGLYTPDANGNTPLFENDITRPNEAYFKWVDKVIRMAEAKGLYIGLLPTWGDKVDKQWGIGPKIFNPNTIGWYGTWLGRRYKNFKNIIWINGGDRWGGDTNFPIWEALGKALRKADKNHLITFHPQGECSSGQWFNNSEWLDFNMAQTGHCQRDYAIYEKLIEKDYKRIPVKPCLDGEPRYENHPVCWLPDSLGWFDDADVRKAMYWSLFSGSFGHTYGCHDIWQMMAPGREPVGHARGNWETSLDLPGAFDLIHARRLMERFDWDNRLPAPEMILSENTSNDTKVVALRGYDHALIYFPEGGQASLDLTNLGSPNSLTLTWMNPRSGEIQESGKPETAKPQISCPTTGRGNDWVLIVARQ